jgi:hypothetical protein
LHCILAVSSCCGKDLTIITEGGGLYTSVVRPILSIAEKCSEKTLSIAADDVFWNFLEPTSALEVKLMLPPLHLFIKLEARQAANRLLGNGCSNVPSIGHFEVLIKMTDEMPLLLAPRDKFVTLNIFSIGLRNVLIWLHRMDSFSLLIELVPV